ncbi:cell division protein FtsH, partial [Anaerobutyricum soehngenii]|nr:cell division protein FtsH [Anaerobutyricum soehngenii]
YKTAKMDSDWGLTERLYRSGDEFTTEGAEQLSPLASFLLSWLIPIILLSALGYSAQMKMMNKISGGIATSMFGMGRSNTKIDVPSEEQIHCSEDADEEEA